MSLVVSPNIMPNPWLLILAAQLLLCGFFLYIFYSEKATRNAAYLATLCAFAVLSHELLRVALRTYAGYDPPVDAVRLLVYRVEHGILAIYYWEVFQYVHHKIKSILANLTD